MKSQSELKKQREKLGLSQRELAEALGVDVGTISRWERGARTPPKYVALALEALERIVKKSPQNDIWASGM